MKKFNKVMSVVMASAMTAALFAGCGNADAGTQTADSAPAAEEAASETGGDTAAAGAFKIGGIGPTTGSAAVYGLAVQNAAQLAVDEINAAGGIKARGEITPI